jgi:hypothetical protein
MIYLTDQIYRQVPDDKIGDKPTLERGWETNGATKYTILNDLKTAIEDGHLLVFDIRILKEMRSFAYTGRRPRPHASRTLNQPLRFAHGLCHRMGNAQSCKGQSSDDGVRTSAL